VPEQALRDYRILIVEDEYLLAEDLRHVLTKAGAIVAGMAGTVKDALELIDAEGKLDAAVLDMNLGGTPVSPVADRLMELGVPFVLTTGYDASAIPERFRNAVRCDKPFRPAAVVRSVKQVIET
jgi:DNA-binding NtrC family response regulator